MKATLTGRGVLVALNDDAKALSNDAIGEKLGLRCGGNFNGLLSAGFYKENSNHPCAIRITPSILVVYKKKKYITHLASEHFGAQVICAQRAAAAWSYQDMTAH